jgi:hypothetical protein
MVKRKVFLAIAVVLASLSCAGGNDNPPFSRGVYLNYQDAKLVIGYTTIAYVNDVLGEPETSVISEHGGDGFYWENLLDNTYCDGRLSLIFSIDKGVLIQIVFRPVKGDEYTSFLNINDQNGRDKILDAFKKSNYDFVMVENSTTIWLTYYKREEPYLEVVCGLQFNEEQSLYALNYHVNAPW